MSDTHSDNWVKRFFKAFLFSPVNLIFIIALSWFGAKAYLWEPSFTNRMIFFGVAGLWIFWIIARYMIVLFVTLALLGGGYYAYYQYSQREVRKCEQSGGVWNKETKTCEAKLSLLEKITRIFFEEPAAANPAAAKNPTAVKNGGTVNNSAAAAGQPAVNNTGNRPAGR